MVLDCHKPEWASMGEVARLLVVDTPIGPEACRTARRRTLLPGSQAGTGTAARWSWAMRRPAIPKAKATASVRTRLSRRLSTVDAYSDALVCTRAYSPGVADAGAALSVGSVTMSNVSPWCWSTATRTERSTTDSLRRLRSVIGSR